MSEFAIKTTGLSKQFGDIHAVEDVSLEVKTGEIFGFLGPNGAGKTTTIGLLVNLLQPTGGEASVLGLDPRTNSTDVNRRIGYLSGDMELYDNLTGAQYFDFMAHLKGSVPKDRIAKLVSRLEANPQQRIGTLSRGNQQKIGLVAALMHDPELLIFDEPTTGLDPLIQAQFNELMLEHRAAGKTVFISSHILSEVQHICDRVGFMRAGKLVEIIDVRSLLNQSLKIIHVVFTRPASKIKLLPNSEVIEQSDKEVTFRYKDHSNKLLAWLTKQPIEDVTIQNSNLDDVFLRLYSKDEGEQNV